ncbi:MAG: response regulator [Gemmatimonadota bacterium]|nr:response regulator [Gemmatimonadota bacterium]
MTGVIVPNAAGLSCLVVDDEPRLRHALVRLMQGDGFRCLEADSGAVALDILSRESVALVLSDMMMPGMMGSELLRHIRAAYPDVAVVMITGVTEVDVAVQCLGLGAMDYLTKPFVLEEVRARVAQALEKRRLILENRGYHEDLERRVRKQAERLESLFIAGVEALAEALELKDPYTRGHSVRVSRYATATATAMGLDADTIGQIELGGHLHDIGKIGVREAVLNKEGRLTSEEYQHIMTHPLLGWKILRPLLGDAPVALNVVRSHHERMDGAGVPDHLAGAEIPHEARIASVADAFDAMVSVRPYRRGLSTADAVAELRRFSGSQFDPDVVHTFVSLVEQGEIQREAPDPSLEDHVFTTTAP